MAGTLVKYTERNLVERMQGEGGETFPVSTKNSEEKPATVSVVEDRANRASLTRRANGGRVSKPGPLE